VDYAITQTAVADGAIALHDFRMAVKDLSQSTRRIAVR